MKNDAGEARALGSFYDPTQAIMPKAYSHAATRLSKVDAPHRDHAEGVLPLHAEVLFSSIGIDM
jgi:hypothetical protein